MNFSNSLELLRCAIRYKNPKLALIATDLVRETTSHVDDSYTRKIEILVACRFVQSSPTIENMRLLASILADDEQDDETSEETVSTIDE